MPAALMYRACCTRLESSVTTQTWTRRAAFLSIRLNSRRNRPYHAAAQSPVYGGEPQILAQLRLRNTFPNPSEVRAAELAQDSASSPDSQENHERSRNRANPYHESGEAGPTRTRPSKDSQNNPFYKHRPRKDPETMRKIAEEQRKAKNKRKEARRTYEQWGYLRHQYSGSELLAVKDQFNLWKRRMNMIAAPENPSSWDWRDDGKWLFELGSFSHMEKAWQELDIESRKQKWPSVMLSTLHFRPEKAVQVLEATLDPLPPGYAISDAAHLCITNLNLQDIKVARERVSKADELLELFSKLAADLPSGYVPFRQHTLGHLAKNLPVEQAAEMHQILCRAGIKMHRNTQLQFASKLAASPAHKDKAFEIVRGIVKEGHDINAPSVASVITTLLHTEQVGYAWSESEDTFSPQRAMEFFLENGFSPNLVSFTALIESLCLQGDIAEAVRLPLLLAENGAKLDHRCYTTVFRGAKDSLKASNVRLALDVARAAKVPHVDVLNNTLHSILYFAEIECREKKYSAPWVLPLFGPMLRIYAKKFDLKPLQWLLPDSLPLILEQENVDGPEKFRSGPRREWEFPNTIVPVVDEFFEKSDGPKQNPNAQTLAIMLRAYVKSLYRPYDLMSFYSFIKTRLEESGPGRNWAAELIKDQGSMVHDTLILVMLERRSLLRPALQVFGDMLRDSLISRPKEKNEEAASSSEGGPAHPAPTIFTFSILIHGLLMRGEKMLAGQLLQTMRENGLEPNIVTWNTLVKGYASMQNLNLTVGTLQDLEAAGFKPDPYTLKAFARLRDQTRALQTMEKIIDANKKRLEQDQTR
ncbi:hypothetical protein FALBO_10802 [Fusarium albosuccineum]|uniref:Pentatricopeptide repeat protein n=1 Tax=Fusarium albosuccineum TaxID=1237068 RepID=A0A8H4L687_9HYPO|nr:hypothetical protein FALBO_10802 [Fusarium albosuccineum]